MHNWLLGLLPVILNVVPRLADLGKRLHEIIEITNFETELTFEIIKCFPKCSQKY